MTVCAICRRHLIVVETNRWNEGAIFVTAYTIIGGCVWIAQMYALRPIQLAHDYLGRQWHSLIADVTCRAGRTGLSVVEF
jgi:hypothetical protein